MWVWDGVEEGCWRVWALDEEFPWILNFSRLTKWLEDGKENHDFVTNIIKKKSRQFLSVLCQGNFGLANHDKERRKVIESGGAVVTEYHTLRNNREENKRRLLRVPWTARRSNMAILKEINPEYSLEGLMLKLKLQLTLATWCKEPTLWKIPWWWEKLKARREWQTMVGWHQWLNGHEFEQTPGDGEGQGGLVSCSP